MSIKNFVKAYAPLPLQSILRVPYHAAMWPFREARLCRIYHRAMKYLPYYQDELSREILRCRIAYIRDGDKNHFFDLGEKYGWVFRSLYGARETEYSGITVIYSSKDKNFQYVRKLLVKLFGSDNASYITLNDFVSGAEIPKNELVLCALGWNEASIAASYAKKRNINIFRETYSTRGEAHYLDVFPPVENEVVIDAGAYDGDTALRFLKWGGDNIQHIYCFELDQLNAKKCRDNLRAYSDKITVIPKGTWIKNETVSVNLTGGASTSINSEGNAEVRLVSIDDGLKGQRVTFIKMDVEGAELKSLMGARKTITQYHPRLAISLYHKPEDIYEIPGYILSLVPQYKFYLRHYNTNAWETVLYAYCD